MFYHKRKVHNCTDVHSRRYELELKLKSSVKPVRREAPKCMLCSKKSYDKEKIEVHYWKLHRDSFKWVECKIDRGRFACSKVREEEFKDLDAVQVMLVGLRAVEERHLEERLKRDRENVKLMASRPSTIERCSFSGEILGCRH